MAEIGYQQLDSGLGKDEDVLCSPEPFLFTPPNTALALLKTYKLRAGLFQLPAMLLLLFQRNFTPKALAEAAAGPTQLCCQPPHGRSWSRVSPPRETGSLLKQPPMEREPANPRGPCSLITGSSAHQDQGLFLCSPLKSRRKLQIYYEHLGGKTLQHLKVL